ncbi:hypothetical protein [Microbulbifer halophilus]
MNLSLRIRSAQNGGQTLGAALTDSEGTRMGPTGAHGAPYAASADH